MRRLSSRSRCGFTLVELLVAMFILGVVMTGILSFTRGTLRFTGLSTAVASSTEDVADAEGYLSDTLRNAKAVFGSVVLVDSVGDTVIDCNLDATNRCVAVLSPVLDTGETFQPIVNFDLSVFSIEPVGSRFATQGLPRGWEGSETLALFEYRVPSICSTSCSIAPSALTVAQRTWKGNLGYVLGGLSDENGAGDPVSFFVQPNEAQLLINFVVRADAQAGQPYIIQESPVALQVAVRE